MHLDAALDHTLILQVVLVIYLSDRFCCMLGPPALYFLNIPAAFRNPTGQVSSSKGVHQGQARHGQHELANGQVGFGFARMTCRTIADDWNLAFPAGILWRMSSTGRRKCIPWHGTWPTCLITMLLRLVTEGPSVSWVD